MPCIELTLIFVGFVGSQKLWLFDINAFSVAQDWRQFIDSVQFPGPTDARL